MFNQTLNNLPKPETQSFIERIHTIYSQLLSTNLIVIGIFTIIIAIAVIIFTLLNKESKHKSTDFLINFTKYELSMICMLIIISIIDISATAIAQSITKDYLTDNDSEINKILPGTNTNILSIKEHNNDRTGKSGIDIYYHDLKIAKIKNNKYHALNQQGTQYEQLINTLLKITNGKHYAVLKIKDTNTNNLKMSFIYQNHTYLVSFKNNSKTTIIKL